MAKWSIKFGEDADADLITFDKRFRYRLVAAKSINEAGNTENAELTLFLTGDVAKSTAVLNADDIDSYITHVLDKHNGKRVRILLDGVVRHDFKPTESWGGTPQILSFQTDDDPGAGESHWRFHLEISVKKFGTLPGGDQVTKLETSIEVSKNEDGDVVQKVWRAMAQSTSYQNAKSIVLSFKPNEPNIKERVGVFPQQAKAEAVWVWEPKRKGTKILRVDEDVVIQGMFMEDWVPDTQVSADGSPIRPILHQMVGRECIITISGTTFSLDDHIDAPEPHFIEGNGFFRARAREVQGITLLHDAARGIYKRTWMEVWIYTGEPISLVPDHGTGEDSHFSVVWELPPGDGPIGNG